MKKILTSAIALALAVGAWAVPARHNFKVYTQADGSTVTMTPMGDEWHHSLVTTDGFAVAKDANGNLCYRTATGVSDVVAHDVAARSAQEKAFLAQRNDVKFSVPARARAKAAKANARRAETQVPDKGAPSVPVILVQYSDVKFSQSASQIVATFDNQFNNGSESCHQYFYDQSYGQYDGKFDILGPVTLTGMRADYGGDDDYYDEDQGVCKMVAEACKGLSNVDWSKYDNDGDKEVDVVVILYAGVGQADSDETDAIWPCQWELSTGAQYGDGPGAITLNGYKIDRFGVFNELGGSYSGHSNKIDGIGTFCHEFSHCLGLPDWYDTEYGNHFGMGNWSILDNGCYNDDGFTPCGYTAYEKDFHNWRALEEAVPNTSYELIATNLEGGKGIKIQSDYDANEYYVLENRQLTGWDKYLPSKGLQVTHVCYNATYWEENKVNNYDTKGMSIIPADNSLKMDAYSSYYGTQYFSNDADQVGDLFPYKGVNELTDESTPAATLYKGGYMGKPITNITQLANGNVTFDFMKGMMAAPVLAEAADVTATSFKAEWNEVEEAQSYILRVMPKGDEAEVILEEDFSGLTANTQSTLGNKLDDYFANPGWTGSSVFFENGGVRLSSSKKAGSLVSPELTAASGQITVAFNAYSYGNDGDITVSVAMGDQKKDVTVSSTEAQSFVVLDAATAGKVTFSALAKKRPVFTAITFYDGDATDQLNEAAAPRRAADAQEIIIEDITTTSYVVTGLTPATTYKFDVKAVADGSESKWSNRQVVTLLEQTALKGDVNGDGIVNGGDVTALYNYLLNNQEVEGNPDVNEDGNVNGGDVTALYNLLLQ